MNIYFMTSDEDFTESLNIVYNILFWKMKGEKKLIADVIPQSDSWNKSGKKEIDHAILE